MERKIALFTILSLFLTSTWANSGQLKLRGVVPVSIKVEQTVNEDGVIVPVIRSNVSKNRHHIRIKTSRTPASIENEQIIIQSN